VLSVAASPDGNWITSGSKDRAVQCWDVRTGKPQFVLHGHKNSVISIAMSEIGGLLATGSGDWQARIFKISGMDEPVAPMTSQAQLSQQPRQATPLVSQNTTNASNIATTTKPAENAAIAKEATKSNSSSAAPEQAKENGNSATASAAAETNGQHNKEGSAPAVAVAPAPVSAKEAIQAATARRDSTPTVTLVGSVASSPNAMKVDPPSSATKAEAHPKVALPTAPTAQETQEKASTSSESAQGAAAV
jgi:WD40 repeat protein